MGKWKTLVRELNFPPPVEYAEYEEVKQRIDRALGALGIPAHLLKPQEKMVTIYRYAFADNNDTQQDFETADKDEAITYAKAHGLAILEQTYTYDDSELVSEWDFREKPEEAEEEEEPTL